MKPTTIFLSLSLLANAALAVAWWWPREAVAPAAVVAKPAAPAKAAALTREQEIAAALAADPALAEALKSGDPKALREALTRAGFPEAYVRDVIVYFMNDASSPENLALLRAHAARPFWKVSPDAEELALRKLLRERETASTALIKEAFGGRIPPPALVEENLQRRYYFLPADKIAAIGRIDTAYNEQTAANRSNRTEEGREKARQAIQAKNEALAQLLTPAELDLYNLNASSTALNMRSDLALFQPSEAEFKAIYDIRRSLDEKYAGGIGIQSPEETTQREADQKAVAERLRALLGDQRYAEYTRTQDYGYRAAVDIASHFNLPPTTATQVYAVQEELKKRWNDSASSPDPKGSAAALLADASTRLTALLGAAGYEAYKKTGGRFWMYTVERVANPSPSR